MYVDGYMLLAIYFVAVLALAVSVYAIWSIIEIEAKMLDLYNKKVKSAWNYYHDKASKNKTKGHWN
jgi:NADH:ubiquinone oxidoreductase subunit 6 (subunit J)